MTEPPSSERWPLIEQLLDAALDLPADQRTAFLDSAVGDDAELGAEVERLLRAFEEPEAYLEQSAQEFAAPILASLASHLAPAAPGARIGPYRILEEAGRGGMAVVYLAERDDGQFRKRVALKLARGGLMLEEELLRRFREERQILAELEHPGIARLLDGGVTEEGLPWFAMEYVEGTPIERYCDERRLSVEARLSLFCAVCDAVQYAHGKGIVHRDLKPSNILVSEPDEKEASEGQVKLLDFGIAKLLAAGSAEEATEHTRPGLRLMTPEYASPEQLRGEGVTPASDVYALGVLLYRLLCGRRPYPLGGRAEPGSGRRVLLTQPEPPSAAVRRAPEAGEEAGEEITPEALAAARGTSPEQLRRRLRGDLDAIVLRALREQPEQRYAVAGELAADLRRHLQGEPVVARRQGRLNRTLAFARRHPVRVGVSTVAVLVLIVAAVLARRPVVPAGLPAGSVVAVLPFGPSVPDTALARLGRDLAVTLAANLDGVGELRTIDILPVLAREADDGSGEQTMAAARRLGAGAIVRGRLMRVGDRVRADAALLLGAGAHPAAHASATATPDSLAALTDSLTWALLREVWRRGPPPTPSLEAITTRSLPALRAFLDGERLMMQGRYPLAARAFARAIESDSTFWYAYWRYTAASLERPVEPRIVEAYLAHRSGFPLRDRLLIEVIATDSLSVLIARSRALAERFREYWPAWWNYANRLVHDGALFGYTHAEARSALEHTLNLNPQLDPAWDHLFWMAAAEGDATVAERSLRELARLRAERAPDPELQFYRYVHHLVRSDGSIAPALADSVARTALAFGPDPRPEWFDQGLLRYGFPEATIDLANRILALDPPNPLAASMHRSIAGAWAARGAWDSALVAGERYANRFADATAALYAYRLAAVGLWQGTLSARDVQRRRAALAPVAQRLAPEQRAELAWLDGLVAATLADAGGLAAARSTLQRADGPAAALLERSLAAFQTDARGDRERAARMLAALEWERADDYRAYRRLSDAHPYLTAVNRLTASRWLLALGDTTAAAGLLAFHEGVPYPLPLTGHANYVLAGPAYLERARIEEAAGRHDVARTYYGQFLRRYDRPVPAHRPRVDEARAAMDRLAWR